ATDRSMRLLPTCREPTPDSSRIRGKFATTTVMGAAAATTIRTMPATPSERVSSVGMCTPPPVSVRRTVRSRPSIGTSGPQYGRSALRRRPVHAVTAGQARSDAEVTGIAASADQAPVAGLAERGGAAVHAELVVDVHQVRLDRRLGDEHQLRDLAVRRAGGQRLEDLRLPRGQGAVGPA